MTPRPPLPMNSTKVSLSMPTIRAVVVRNVSGRRKVSSPRAISLHAASSPAAAGFDLLVPDDLPSVSQALNASHGSSSAVRLQQAVRRRGGLFGVTRCTSSILPARTTRPPTLYHPKARSTSSRGLARLVHIPLSGRREDVKDPAGATHRLTAVKHVGRNIEAVAHLKKLLFAALAAIERALEDETHLHLRMVVNGRGRSFVDLDKENIRFPRVRTRVRTPGAISMRSLKLSDVKRSLTIDHPLGGCGYRFDACCGPCGRRADERFSVELCQRLPSRRSPGEHRRGRRPCRARRVAEASASGCLQIRPIAREKRQDA